MTDKRYYVYVYIDPRNYEEFYYGKGCGSRRLAHKNQEGDSDKLKRIHAIRDEHLEPVIRTIAAGLTEVEAHLIETTLIWKLGRTLTNKSAGYYVSKFRPQNTLHKDVPGFDFQSQIYYVNVGHGGTRKWEDCREYGFLSAGGGPRFRDQITGINPGDVVVAYVKGRGYVGVGKVKSPAVRYLDYRVDGYSLDELDLESREMAKGADDPDKSEYVLSVKWVNSVPRDKGKWKKSSGLYTTQLVRASLANQPKTLKFLEKAFSVDLTKLAR